MTEKFTDVDKIYMADLTHDGMMLSSNVFPLSIGLIASYIIKHRPNQVQVELFKYTSDLSNSIATSVPKIVAFANYSWNFSLARAYAETIKEAWPETIIIFGGPNYGLTDEELKIFWSRFGHIIDFYVAKEGEEGFLQLYDGLRELNFDIKRFKNCRSLIGNVHYFIDGEVVLGPELARIKLDQLPSPYLDGIMDKFFDDKLIPLIHTTRGCPFKCSFCTEGSVYYNKVEQRIDPLEKEMQYISKRIKGPPDLFISDANFGMFKQDIKKAEIIKQCQRDYGYPKYIHVSTGKNQKERVIEIVQSLNGAISMAASLQSTDPTVLENIDRSNISAEKLMEVGKKANTAEMGTYSELILGLPGDTFDKHENSLRDTVTMEFDNIRMYQLIMLPQTKLNTPQSRQEYGMQTGFRIMPRSFGQYSIGEHKFVAVESEEILVASNTLSHEDYVRARELDLTVEILHNGRIHSEIVGICNFYGLSWFDDIIMPFYHRRREFSEGISKMYDAFVIGTSDRLWGSEQELVEFVTNNIDELLLDERGTNEMSTGKSTAFFALFQEINKALFTLLSEKLLKSDKNDPWMETYLSEIEHYSVLRKLNLFSRDEIFSGLFSFDLNLLEKVGFNMNETEARLSCPQRFSLVHDSKQKGLISEYSKEFGATIDGLGKMLMRYPYIHRLFRIAEAI
jgi:radical SAM superfamily enzyme YgiQ (UPF0313 family)